MKTTTTTTKDDDDDDDDEEEARSEAGYLNLFQTQLNIDNSNDIDNADDSTFDDFVPDYDGHTNADPIVSSNPEAKLSNILTSKLSSTKTNPSTEPKLFHVRSDSDTIFNEDGYSAIDTLEQYDHPYHDDHDYSTTAKLAQNNGHYNNAGLVEDVPLFNRAEVAASASGTTSNHKDDKDDNDVINNGPTKDTIMEEKYHLAENYLRQKNYEGALRLFQSILKQTSRDIKYHKSKGTVASHDKLASDVTNTRSHDKLLLYASTLYHIGLLFHRFQLHGDAVPYFQKCAKFSREYLGEYHPFVSSSLVKSGLSLLQQNTNEAHQLETGILTLREAARLSKITRGKDSDKTAKCCVYLGYGYALYGIALNNGNDVTNTTTQEILSVTSSPNHSNSSSPSNRTSSSNKKSFHARTQSTNSNLSQTLGLTPNSKAKKCIEKASKYYAESLGIYRGILRRANDTNDITLRSTRLAIATTLEFIIELQVHLKKWSKAIGSLSEVLEIQSFVLGDAHPNTRRASKRMEDLTRKIHQMEESVAEAFVLHDFLNNASHAISNGNEANLAAINKNKNYTVLDYMQKAHYQVYANKSEADWVTCRQCLEMAANLLKQPSHDHDDLALQAKLLNNLGVAYFFHGYMNLAIEPLNTVDCTSQALLYLTHALQLCQGGNHHTISADNNGTDNVISGTTSGELLLKSTILLNLSHVLLVASPSENSHQALEYLTLSLGIKRHIFGALHPSVMSCLDHLATTQTQLRLYLDAMTSFSTLIKSQVEFYGENHICVATTNGKLANLYIQSRDYESAIQCLRKVQRYQKIQVMTSSNADADDDVNNDVMNEDVKMLEATNMAIEKIRGLCEQNRVWI